MKSHSKRIYLEPDPLKPGKVVVEYVSGSIFSVAGGILFAVIGSQLTYQHEANAELNFSGIPGAAIGYLVGSTIGNSYGVCIGGNSRNERGSTWVTLGGAALGTVAGVGVAAGLASSDNMPIIPIMAAFTLTQSTGAVLGFNLTREKVVIKIP